MEKLLGKRARGKKSGDLTIGANWPHSFFRAAALNDPLTISQTRGRGMKGGFLLFDLINFCFVFEI